MKKYLKNFLFKFILVIMIICLIILVLYITYFFYVNKSYKSYEKNINKIVSTVQKINSDIYELYDNNTYDTKKVSEILSSKINSLTNTKNKLNGLNPAQKYQNSFEYLSNGLSYNIKLYKYTYDLINSLSDDADDKIENYIDAINNSKDNCIINYTNFSKLNDSLSVTLPKQTLNLIDNSINYSYFKVKEQKNKEIVHSQLLDFEENINNYLSQFTSISNDYSVYLETIRNNDKSMSYDDLLDLVSADLTEIAKLKQNYYNLTIPKQCVDLYNSFKRVLDDYEAYGESFKYTLNIEKVKFNNDNLDNDSLNSMYKNTKDKFLKFQDSYDSFMDSYKSFKKDLN